MSRPTITEAVVNRGLFAVMSAGLPPTELPWYAENGKDPHDRIFTKKEIARHCWAEFRRVARKHRIPLAKLTFIEPAAGEGCFTDLLPLARRISLDIAPERADTEKADFLSWTPPHSARYAVIGNPPFGVRGAVALAFLNRAAMFADIVGFILPMTFASNGKGGAMTRVRNLTLLHSEELPANSFYQPDGKDRAINTLFQVWAHKRGAVIKTPDCSEFADIYTVCTSPDRRCGLVRLARGEYDFFVSGTFYGNAPPGVVRDFSEVNYGSGYGIIIKKKKREVARALKKADWLHFSSRSTNHCRHIRMAHIRAALVAAGFGQWK